MSVCFFTLNGSTFEGIKIEPNGWQMRKQLTQNPENPKTMNDAIVISRYEEKSNMNNFNKFKSTSRTIFQNITSKN